MPLTELMNYFNDQLQAQGRSKSLPRTGFYKADNTYWARFGSLMLGSQFLPIQKRDGAGEIGFEAKLIVRAATGNLLNIDSIFNSLDNLDQIIHLDRLVRTLHSLNYLQQFDGQLHLLSLQVQPRHIVSVADNHGKTFESILSDCGLKPERVLLHTRLLDQATLKHFRNALSSYRERGYRIGLTLHHARELNFLANLGLAPDVIFIRYPELSWVLQTQGETRSSPYLEPIEFYQAKRILVTGDDSVLSSLPEHLDGYLVAHKELPDSNSPFQYANVL